MADAPPLGPLLRKAAADAGFDLEPERDGAWWRLRAGGAPGVVWVHPLPAAGAPLGTAAPGAPTALLALPTPAQLAALDAPTTGPGVPPGPGLPAPPPGAAGCAPCPSPERLHAWLRRTWLARAASPERLRARWEGEADAQLAAAGLPAGAALGTGAAAPPLVTEVVAAVRRRVGQDLFREALLGLWEGRCAVTGLAVPALLRASHAKPWRDATDAERLDVYNGLLLAAHVDALFDAGLLTFDAEGRGVGSPRLRAGDWAALGLTPEALRVRGLRPQHGPYLAWHRAHVFAAG